MTAMLFFFGFDAKLRENRGKTFQNLLHFPGVYPSIIDNQHTTTDVFRITVIGVTRKEEVLLLGPPLNF